MADGTRTINEYTAELHELCNSMARYRAADLNASILQLLPKNGIYVIFEAGECAFGLDRIVRIGTHTGNNQLPSRLKQHFIAQNKDRSVFRKHVGAALLLKTGDSEHFLPQWSMDFTTHASRENPANYYGVTYEAKKREVEAQVTAYMHECMSFAVFPVATKEERLYLEEKLISTLSWCTECRASAVWLGNFAKSVQIRKARLWNVNGVFKDGDTWLNEDDMQNIRRYCGR